MAFTVLAKLGVFIVWTGLPSAPGGADRCFHRICEDAKKESMPGRCPNCRAEFDEERIRKQRLDPAK